MNSRLRLAKKVVLNVLSIRKYKVIFAITSISFALFYMVFTGIFIFTERAIPDGFTVPKFIVGQIHTQFGVYPWFLAYVTRHLIFSMSSEALVSTSIISALVGTNSSLLAYRFSSASNKMSCSLSKGSFGFFGIIPAFLSIFGCCGGGVLVLIFGGGILASLFPYGPAFSLTSIVALTAGILMSTKGLEKISTPI